jgi:hypothetical protein
VICHSPHPMIHLSWQNGGGLRDHLKGNCLVTAPHKDDSLYLQIRGPTQAEDWANRREFHGCDSNPPG